MTKSNPYFKCTKCIQAEIERLNSSLATVDVFWYCNCPDEEEQLIVDKEKNCETIQFVSKVLVETEKNE